MFTAFIHLTHIMTCNMRHRPGVFLLKKIFLFLLTANIDDKTEHQRAVQELS